VPLSEHEQRLLEQMERALYQEDPKFASSLRDGGSRRGNRRLIALGVVLVLGGIGALIGGVATSLVIVGIGGFVLMLVGAYLVVRALRAPAPEAEGAPAAPAAAAPKAGKSGKAGKAKSGGFMDRVEDRFKRRRDEQQGGD
jgi:hypothetical protein